MYNSYGKKITCYKECTDDFMRVRWCFHVQRSTRNPTIRKFAEQQELKLCKKNRSLLTYALNLRHRYNYAKGVTDFYPSSMGNPNSASKTNYHLDKRYRKK